MAFSSWLRIPSTPSTRCPARSGRQRTNSRSRSARPVLERLEDRLAPSAGQLDPSFGQGGIVTTNIGGPSLDSARAIVASQSDGKVIVVGTSTSYGGTKLAVVRYNTDGSRDNTFGTSGEVTFNFTAPSPGSNGSDAAAGVVIDSAGHVIIAGASSLPSYYSQQFAVAELNADGTFNNNFGSGGIATFHVGAYPGIADTAAGVALDSAGHIIIAGTYGYSYSSIQSIAVARLNADGSLDTTFGTGGSTTLSFGSNQYELDSAAGVVVDANGRVVVAGTATGYSYNPTYSYSPPAFAVARLTGNGTLDSTFGSGGESSVRVGYASSAVGMALDSAGHIVIGGTSTSANYNRDFAVAELNSDGTVNSGFGSSGATTVNFGNGINYESDSAAGLAVDASNRVVVAGTAGYYLNQSYHFSPTVMRLNTSGTLDSSFGTGGTATFSLNSPAGMTLDPSGRVDVVGTNVVNSPSFAVTRLDGSGNLDTSWGGSGLVTTNITGLTSDSAADLTLTQPDGKIVVVGLSQPYDARARLAVTRYNPDGSLDSTFGTGGTVLFNFGSAQYLLPRAISVDSSGRLLIAGGTQYFYYSPGDFAVLRLNSDGTADTSFGTAGRATVHFPSPYSWATSTASATGVTVDAAGDIVLAGSELPYGYGNSYFAVARLTSKGSLDTSFGSGSGEVTISYANSSYAYETDAAAGVAIDGAGHIIVGGSTYWYTYYPSYSSSNGQHFAVTRLNSDGSFDSTFGSGGKTTISFAALAGGASGDTAAGVALDPSGRIVVAGTSSGNYGSYGYGNAFAVARLNAADGSLDTSFGTGGEATVSNFAYGTSFPQANRLAIDSTGRIAMVGTLQVYNPDTPTSGNDFAAALFKTSGCPDVDFGTGGVVVTPISSGYNHYDSASGAAFDSAGRLVVAGTSSSYSPVYHSTVAVVRYLGHDPVIDASPVSFAANLQSAISAMQASPPPATPRVVVHVKSAAQLSTAVSAIAGMVVNPSGPNVQVLLDLDVGSYSLGSVSVPAGLTLLIDGDGGSYCEGTFASSSGPVLTLVSGNVVIRDGAQFSGTGNFPTIVVQGGQLTMRNSTVTETTTTNQAAIAISGGQVDLGTTADPYDPNSGGNTISINGPGVLMRLAGPNNVMAVGDTFVASGTVVSDNYQIENLIDHSLDGFSPGTVFWVPNNVYVTKRDAVIQRGVNVVPVSGTVNVQAGVQGPFYVGSKLLTISYGSNGPTITQQADTLDPTKRELQFADNTGNSSVKFVAGTNPGEVQVNINNLPSGTFLPTGRLIANAGYDDDVTVDSALTLSAWLYSGGNCRLKGGGGNNVLIGSGSDLLVGGPGRNLLIGNGNDRLVSNGGQDILIAGYGVWQGSETALAAIMAEWTSSDSLATRLADLTDDTSSPYFTGTRLNGNYFLIASGPNQTVYSDGGSDTVTCGGAFDVLFASTTDKITGLTAADQEFIIAG
jgi:uncharacterized delta-60 repeat protein